jgi:hypothetical protein
VKAKKPKVKKYAKNDKILSGVAAAKLPDVTPDFFM